MKNKISNKLTLANAVIVVAALLVFCVLALGIFNGYVRKSIKEQLITENSAAYKIAAVNVLAKAAQGELLSEIAASYVEPRAYSNLAESVSIILMQTARDDSYKIIYSSEDGFEDMLDIAYIEAQIADAEDGVAKININHVSYFCTMEQSVPRGVNGYSLAAISLLPLSSVKELNRQYIRVFIFTAIILVVLSLIIISAMSGRITNPVVKITELAKQYAKLNFRDKYIANTNDEIEDLSIAVREMADSLEEHNTQRDKMLRNISHELKTPLTAIYGYAEGIKNGVFLNHNEPLDIIMSESLRIKKMTEDIIYLSKLESHIEVFSFARCDISETVVSAIRSIESIAIMNDIDIRFMPEKIEPISIDGEKIHRALINILSNCVKYTKDLIDIRINDMPVHVEIVIADNGEGFKSEDIKNLLSGMSKEKSNGSGIGLSIVNEIVKGHKGEFYIGNGLSGGAVFRIVLQK